MINIEFMSTKLTEKVKRRFHKYAVHARKDIWHSIISMHVALVKKFVKEDVLKSRLLDVLNMRDNIIFEKFGRKQYEEGRVEGHEEGRVEGHEEIAIELLKNKDLSLDYISDLPDFQNIELKL